MYGGELDIFRFIFGLAVLLSASYSDVRTRLVSDAHWQILAAVAAVLCSLEAYLDGGGLLEILAVLGPYGTFQFFMNADYIYDSKEGVNWPYVPVVALGAILPVYAYLYGSYQAFLYTYPSVMMWIFFVMYYYGIIGGGADAKAVMVLTMLFPAYPKILTAGGMAARFMSLLPLGTLVFHPSLTILMNASLGALLLPFVFFFYNLAHGNISPLGFLGIKIPPGQAKRSFYWPMEYIDDNGKLKKMLFPTFNGITKNDTIKMFYRLEQAGYKDVWVNPKLPFIVFITFGYIAMFLWGNIIVELILGPLY